LAAFPILKKSDQSRTVASITCKHTTCSN